MSEGSICRVCLTVGVRMLTIVDTPLQSVYEKLVMTELQSAGRPVAACYTCYARLHKSHELMLTAVRAETVLTAMLVKYSKVSVQSVSKVDRQVAGLCRSLTISPPELTDNLLPVTAKVKTEVETDVKTECGNEVSDAGASEAADVAVSDDDDDEDPFTMMTLQQLREMKTEAELQTGEGSAEPAAVAERREYGDVTDPAREALVDGEGVASGQRAGDRKQNPAADDSSDEKRAARRDPARSDQRSQCAA